MDVFQERYIAHQKRKKEILFDLMKQRYSERIFSDKEVEPEKIKRIIEMLQYIPSSCNRRAVEIKLIESRDDKQVLSGLLVGGVGWIHRANKILLLIAHIEAYKEFTGDGDWFMPYLDAGIMIQQIYLSANYLGLKCCFVNPNIRVNHYPTFDNLFLNDDADLRFCGAMAIGYGEENV